MSNCATPEFDGKSSTDLPWLSFEVFSQFNVRGTMDPPGVPVELISLIYDSLVDFDDFGWLTLYL